MFVGEMVCASPPVVFFCLNKLLSQKNKNKLLCVISPDLWQMPRDDIAEMRHGLVIPTVNRGKCRNTNVHTHAHAHVHAQHAHVHVHSCACHVMSHVHVTCTCTCTTCACACTCHMCMCMCMLYNMCMCMHVSCDVSFFKYFFA